MLRRGAPFLAGMFTGLLSSALLLLLISEPRGTPIELQPRPTPQPLRVHVTGAVVRPGVYELPPDAIVQTALESAGGPQESAVLSALNLAQPLQNGSQIYVPSSQEDPEREGQQRTITAPGSPDGADLLHVNEATVAELERLPGIGPTLAQAIVQYREENGAFQSKEDLQDVPGIGPAKLSAIEDLIEVP